MCAGGDDNKGEYKQYNAGQMALAVQSRGTMSVRKLADYWGLPRTSLRREIDKQSAEVVPAVAHVAGGQQVLSLAAEDALVRQIELAALHHDPLSILELRQHAFKLAHRSPPTNTKAYAVCDAWRADGVAGEDWWRGFRHRHPNVKTNAANLLEHARSEVTQLQLDSMLQEIGKLRQQYPHLAGAEYWYDADEVPVKAGGDRQLVLTVAGTDPNMKSTRDDKLGMTALPCVCADGTEIPPMFITDGKEGTTPGWWNAKFAALLVGTPLAKATCVCQV